MNSQKIAGLHIHLRAAGAMVRRVSDFQEMKNRRPSPANYSFSLIPKFPIVDPWKDS
jgi:hypothetical protein